MFDCRQTKCEIYALLGFKTIEKRKECMAVFIAIQQYDV